MHVDSHWFWTTRFEAQTLAFWLLMLKSEVTLYRCSANLPSPSSHPQPAMADDCPSLILGLQDSSPC